MCYNGHYACQQNYAEYVSTINEDATGVKDKGLDVLPAWQNCTRR